MCGLCGQGELPCGWVDGGWESQGMYVSAEHESRPGKQQPRHPVMHDTHHYETYCKQKAAGQCMAYVDRAGSHVAGWMGVGKPGCVGVNTNHDPARQSSSNPAIP